MKHTSILLLLCVLTTSTVSAQSESLTPKIEAGDGFWTYTFGTPEAISYTATRHFAPSQEALALLPAVGECPRVPTAEKTERGLLVHIPLDSQEKLYGLGLQMKSFQLRGSRKEIRVNADPENKTGDSHAPVPFYVSTGGYGVFIDNARYLTYYFDKTRLRDGGWPEVTIEIPRAEGTSIIIFGGPTMKDAIARYNLYSGGGCVPPRWGLGMWYRVKGDFTQEEVMAMSKDMRNTQMPCDVLGLEPGWQTRTYSCSFVWSNKFPEPAQMMGDLLADGYRVNLWEHCYTHPEAPFHEAIKPWSGDRCVWGGLVPDFITPEARKIFADYTYDTTLSIGASGFKADECDNSDFTGDWCFPLFTQFPSGADGEQMHMMLGLRYQDALLEALDRTGNRSYNLVRNSSALAAPYPFVLYSDLYDHQTFINSVAVSGFSGLLWTPEVRHANTDEELIRRMQSVVLSPMALVNAWYLKHQPWLQIDRGKNNDDILSPTRDATSALCREAMEWRMQLIPYLHAAFVRYHNTGVPPFRALVTDYPDDKNVQELSSQYLIGESLMAAPITAGHNSIDVYFPEGIWYDFFTGERHEGGKKERINVPLERTPLYVKEGTVLPLAHITQHTEDAASHVIDLRIYGNCDETPNTVLYTDDNSLTATYDAVTFLYDSRKGTAKITADTKANRKFYTLGNVTRVE